MYFCTVCVIFRAIHVVNSHLALNINLITTGSTQESAPEVTGWRVENILRSMGPLGKKRICNLNGTNSFFYILAGLDFEALLIKPKEVKDGVKLPLIVTPHGLLLSLWLYSHYLLVQTK